MTHGFWYYNYMNFELIQSFIDKYGPIKSIYVIPEAEHVILAAVVSTDSITKQEAQEFWNRNGGTDGIKRDWLENYHTWDDLR